MLCITGKKIDAENETVLPRGTLTKKTCLSEEKDDTGNQMQVNHGNKFCHPAHDDENQQQAEAAAATAVYQHNTQQQARTYEYILVRRAAA